MPYITIQIDRQELRRLQALAKAEDRTPAQQAKRLLRLALTLAQEGGEPHGAMTTAPASCEVQ